MTSNSANSPGTMVSDRQRIFAIIKASFGNLLEWSGFYFYPFMAIYFSSVFFPNQTELQQLLQATATSAVGFLARPVGGWFYGRLADQQGRRHALVHAGVMMFLGSLLLAITPTYASIGYAAPFILLCARLLQGFSVGGGYGASATYMSEAAIKKQRAFLSSFQYTTLIGGQLLASLVVVILQQFLSTPELKAWGWRIPFGLAALSSLVSIWVRLSLQETSTPTSRHNKQSGSLRHLLQYKDALISIFVITAAGSVSFYTFTVYMQKYLINSLHFLPTTASAITTATLFFFMILQPIFGILSDRIGRLIPMMIFSGLMMLFTIPVIQLMNQTQNVYIVFGLIMSMLVVLSFYTSIGGLIKAELFPKEVRALGVGVSYGISNALFGGTTEWLALQIKSVGFEYGFYWYLTALCAASLFVSIRYLPRLLQENYLDR